MLCWLDVGEVTIAISPVAVRVVHVDHLIEMLENSVPAFDSAQIELISKAADSPSCWTDEAVAPANVAWVLDSSTEMLLDIEQRTRVRRRWKIGIRLGVVVGVIAIFIALYPLLPMPNS